MYYIFEDTKTECSDKYTCLYGKPFINRSNRRKVYQGVGFNACPTSPNMGIYQHLECEKGRHLGKRITLGQLPENARKVLENELREVGEIQ